MPYSLRDSTNLVLPKARTNLYGIDTVRFVGQKLWQSVPKEIKESQALDIFKRNRPYLSIAAVNYAKVILQI